VAADRKTVVQVKFRLRKDLLRAVEKAAKAVDRSVNEMIEKLIEEALQRRDQDAHDKKLIEETILAIQKEQRERGL
jgi:hypothetical protein